jgi:hypothetical protein
MTVTIYKFYSQKFQTPGKSLFTLFLSRHLKCPGIEITNLYKCGVSKNSYCATHTTFQAIRKEACKHGLDRTMKSNVTLLSHGPLSGRTRSGNLTNETLSGWAAATVVEQWHSPPAAGTLPCGSTKGVAQATAVPK